MPANHVITTTGTMISLKNITQIFDGKVVLRDVSGDILDIHETGFTRGQVVALVGPSGCGKTTLLKIMAGLRKPTSGTVLVEHRQQPVEPGLIGVVDQKSTVFWWRTVLGNLEVAATMGGFKGKDAADRCQAMMDRFGIRDLADKYPRQISGGQRQRLAIARQLLCSGHILILDEPTSGLDPLMKWRACETIVDIAGMDEQNTIVIITHDIHVAARVADTIWLLGLDRDEAGNWIPGARLQKSFNLIELGLAWEPNVHRRPEFHQFVDMIMFDEFPKLCPF